MLSTEKVGAALAELKSFDADTPETMMAAAAAEFLLPQLLPMLPDDPDVLDHLLTQAATRLLELRSDVGELAAHELPAGETV